MFADPKKNAARRLRRRMKAGASILLAVAAGAFLACQKTDDTTGPSVGPNPGGPDARGGPEPLPASSGGTADAAAGTAASAGSDAGAATDAGAALVVVDAGGDAGGALVVRDAGVPGGKKPHVDRKEHRSGMPVRDNLLE